MSGCSVLHLLMDMTGNTQYMKHLTSYKKNIVTVCIIHVKRKSKGHNRYVIGGDHPSGVYNEKYIPHVAGYWLSECGLIKGSHV